MKATLLLLPLVVGDVSAVSMNHGHTTLRLHSHAPLLRRYFGAFLDMLNPVPQLSKDPERLLTKQQRSFLEAASDPHSTYLVWQGAMKAAKQAGTYPTYVDPEMLLPRALHQVEFASRAEKAGDFSTARMLRKEAAVDVTLAMKTMGELLGIENQDRFWRSCVAHGKGMWKDQRDASSERSLAFMETIESLLHGQGLRLLQTRKKREQIKRKLDKVTEVHTQIDELKEHSPDSMEFQRLLGRVSDLLHDAETIDAEDGIN